MPDRRRRHTEPRWNSVVAAAHVITAPNMAVRSASIGRSPSWQNDAWVYFDRIGELRFGVQWISNALSRVNLVAAMPALGPGDEPTPIDFDDPRATPVQKRAIEIVAAMANGATGQGQMLGSFGTHLTVAGIGWLVVEPDLDDPEADELAQWNVYSSEEVRQSQSHEGLEIRIGESSWRPVHPNGVVVKVWRRHPRANWQPDSPTRGVLNVLREIDMLSQHIHATAQSRLAGAGILAIPAEAVFPPGQGPQTSQSVDPDDENITPPQDMFVETLIDAMTTPLIDRGSAAAVVPLVIKVPGDLVDKMKHLTFSTPFDDKVLDLMEGAIKRLALGLDIPPEVLTGTSGLNHWCVPTSTKAYTRRGWVSPDSLHVGDVIMAVDSSTGRLVWDEVRDMYRATLNDEPMLRVHVHGARRGEMTIEMTPGHRNLIERDGVRLVVTADQLQPGDVIPTGATKADWPTEAKFSDAFVQLLAWYSADGTCTRRHDGSPGQIRIGKSWKKNPDKVRQLCDVLTDVFGAAVETMPYGSKQPMWRLEMQERGMAMCVLNGAARDVILDVMPGFDKIIPTWVVDSLTAAQAELFLRAWGDSDGTSRNGEWNGVIHQVDGRRLEAVEYAAISLGYGVRRFVETKHDAGRFSDRPLHGLRIGQQRHRKVRNVEPITASCEVWCPTTNAGTWLAQDAATGWSFVTGNSSWQVAEEAITMHIEPLSEVVVNALTIGFLRPALEAEGFDPEEVMVWYDTTDLRTRPDRSRSAVEAYDRLELSGEAMLREMGLNVDEMPTPEEKRERLLISIARGAPTLAPAILAELGYASRLPETQDETSNEPATVPALDRMPDTRDNVQASALVAACDIIVHRALERAGSRLRSAAGKRTPGGAAAIDCPDPARLHLSLDATEHADLTALLDGAWSLVAEVAERHQIDAGALTATLDAYTRGLLAAGHGHTHDRLASALGVTTTV